jgi:soluble lytic murein transglycosylase-like protein
MGLMQLMPGTARDMYVRDVWSPEENIDGGARYLRTLANKYDGDLMKTLAAYNAGPEAVKRAGGVPSYPETQEYVKKVIDLYGKLKRQNARSDG